MQVDLGRGSLSLVLLDVYNVGGNHVSLLGALLGRLSLCLCVCQSLRVDRRLAVYADGPVSGVRKQQMPKVTPTAAFH